MTKKTLCRTVSIFLSALLLTSAVGCSKDGSQSSPSEKKTGNEKSSVLDISFDCSYKGEKANIDSDVQYFSTVTELNDSILLSGYANDGKNKIFLYHLNDGTTEKFDLTYPASLDNKTDCYVVSNFLDSENHPVFIYHTSIYDEKNEENPYQDLGYTMEIYDENFKLLETKNLSDIVPADNYFSFITPTKDGSYCIALNDNMTGASKLCIFDKDFKQTGEISGSIQYVQNIFTTQDGKTIILYEDEDWNNCFGTINPDTNAIEPLKIEGTPEWFNTAFEGKQGYDLFIRDSEFVYGINLETNTCSKVINWVNSDFMGESIDNVLQLKDGRFFVVETDYTAENAEPEIWFLKERDPKELENVKLITLATLWLPTQLGKAVNQFNRTHTDCRIGVANYDRYSTDDGPDAGLEKFENDMTSGIVADIICLSYMPYEKYANKGLFLDLSDYVSQLNPDDYFMNFFDSLKYGDKIYRIGFSYNVETLEAKTKNVGDKSGLSLAEFSDLIKNTPNGMKSFSSMSKESALYSLCINNLNSFIDLNAHTCNFNSPEFIQLLELCNSYPSEEEDSRSNWTDEQWEKYWAEESYQYINDKTLFYEASIYNPRDYLDNKYLYFDKEETTLVGYPTTVPNSNGGKFSPDYTISISSNSAFKDQIWEFCQSLLSEESQESLSWSMPVRKEAFDKAIEKSLIPDTYTDENGKEQEYPHTVYRGEEEINIPAFTKADTDRIKSYIENIKESSYYDEKIYNIVNEEAQKYFSGDQTAEKTAEMIQSRASLYISEQT